MEVDSCAASKDASAQQASSTLTYQTDSATGSRTHANKNVGRPHSSLLACLRYSSKAKQQQRDLMRTISVEEEKEDEEEEEQQQQQLTTLDLEQQLLAWQADGVCFPVQMPAGIGKASSNKLAATTLQRRQQQQQQQQQQLQQQQQYTCKCPAAYGPQSLIKPSGPRVNSCTDAKDLYVHKLSGDLEQQQQQQQQQHHQQQAETAAALKRQVMMLKAGKRGLSLCSDEDESHEQQHQLFSAAAEASSCGMEQPYELHGGVDTRRLTGTSTNSSSSSSSSRMQVCCADQQQHHQRCNRTRSSSSSVSRDKRGGYDHPNSKHVAQPAALRAATATAVVVPRVHALEHVLKAGHGCGPVAANPVQEGLQDKQPHSTDEQPAVQSRCQPATSKQVGKAAVIAGPAAAVAGPFKPRPPSCMARQQSLTRPGVQLKKSLSAAVAAAVSCSATVASAAFASAANVATQAGMTESSNNRAATAVTLKQAQQPPRALIVAAAAAVSTSRVEAATATAARAAAVEPCTCSSSSSSSSYNHKLGGIACITGLLARHGGCVPIAVARHCPSDIHAHSWQPREFVQTHKLYEGKIATVLQGYHAPSGRPLALKVYNRSRLDVMERFQLAREVCLHMRSCHPYIISLYAAFKDTRHIYLLMELAPRGNLYQLLMSLKVPQGCPKRLDESAAVTQVIKPLLSALAFLHDQGIIHRDIKLENVLLAADGSIKLADFGLSIDTQHEPANTRLGTQGYFAPEVLTLPLKASPFEGKSPAEAAARPSYTCKADVWSAGVVCFEVLTGRAPFAAENVAQVVKAILHRTLVYPDHLSSHATSFLKAALTRDASARPTSKELLQHPFITPHS